MSDWHTILSWDLEQYHRHEVVWGSIDEDRIDPESYNAFYVFGHCRICYIEIQAVWERIQLSPVFHGGNVDNSNVVYYNISRQNEPVIPTNLVIDDYDIPIV